jgi:uncharacterized protein YbjT (DUF2867 family)
MRVAVAGGTGLAGRHVAAALTARGHEPVLVARSRGVDLGTGDGLDAALAGVDTVVDASNITTTSGKAAVAFFDRAGRNLVAAGRRAGVRHHVVLSIVGIDRVGWGYYQGKLRQEELVKDGAAAWTVMRATQFHEFADQVLAMVPGPLALVPRMRAQPVAVREVAEALAELAAGPPRGVAPELAGPRVESVPDMARRLLRARGSRRPVLALPLPGAAGKGMAGGALLPAADGPRGLQTFDEWVAETAGTAARAAGQGAAAHR